MFTEKKYSLQLEKYFHTVNKQITEVSPVQLKQKVSDKREIMEQVLQLDPKSELRFRGPFTEVVTSLLKLSNPSERRVCFKVKTTAPKRYCVRPNSGVIEPRQAMTVHVMLQPFEYDPNERNKHKFMVQSMYAPEGMLNLESLWKDADKEQLMDSKLRCVFEIPNEDGSVVEQHMTSSQHHEVHDVFSNSVQDTAGHHQHHPNATTTDSSDAFTSGKSQAVMSQDGADQKLREENKRLRDEVLSVRKENATLREEGIRLRMKSNISSDKSEAARPISSGASGSGGQSSQMVTTLGFSNQTLLIYAFVLLACGFVIGKFIF